MAMEVGSHRAVMRVISGIVPCIFLAAVDQTVVIPAVPAISADLHADANLVWVLTSYLLTSTVVAPIYGRVSDTHGRRPLLMIALSLFILTSVACGFAANLRQLILFRGLQGIGGGGLMSLAQASIADAVSPRQRGRYQGYLAAVWGFASISGPLIGGFTAEHASWRWLFWINLPIGLIALYLCRRGLPRPVTAKKSRSRFDVVGSMLMTIGVTLLLLTLAFAGKTYDRISAPIILMATLSVIAFWLLSMQQKARVDGLLPPRLFTDAVLNRALFVALLSAASVFACLFCLPMLFQRTARSSIAGSSLLMMPFLIAHVFGNYMTGHLASWRGRMKPVLTGASAISVLGFFSLTMTVGWTSYPILVLMTAVTDVGLGSCTVGTIMAAQNAAPSSDVGVATGSLLLMRAIGSMLGSAIAGAVLDAYAGSSAAVQNPPGGAPVHDLQGFAGLVPVSAFAPIFAAGTAMMLTASTLCVGMPDRSLLDNRPTTPLD
jgi:EmrB/QacA subfamily drug resistance transporter